MNNEPNLQPQENEQSQIQQPEVQQVPIQQTQTPPVIYVQQPVNQPVVYVQPPAFAVQPAHTQVNPAGKTSHKGKGLALSIIGMILGIVGIIEFLYLILYGFLYSFIIPVFLNSLPYGSDEFGQEFMEFGANFVYSFALVEYLILAVVAALIGLILSIKGKKLSNSRMAKTGIHLSIITLIGSALVVSFIVPVAMGII